MSKHFGITWITMAFIILMGSIGCSEIVGAEALGSRNLEAVLLSAGQQLACGPEAITVDRRLLDDLSSLSTGESLTLKLKAVGLSGLKSKADVNLLNSSTLVLSSPSVIGDLQLIGVGKEYGQIRGTASLRDYVS